VKKPKNYGKVQAMVGDVIAEIPKENKSRKWFFQIMFSCDLFGSQYPN
jgi:hypothetical protein